MFMCVMQTQVAANYGGQNFMQISSLFFFFVAVVRKQVDEVWRAVSQSCVCAWAMVVGSGVA